MKYKGTLIINFPDIQTTGFSKNSMEINSDKSDSYELRNELSSRIRAYIKKIDKKTIEPEFIEPTCRSGYCDRSVINLKYTENDTIFTDTGDIAPIESLIIEPTISQCGSIPVLISNCKFKSKENGCLGCKSPYMQIVIDSVKSMQK